MARRTHPNAVIAAYLLRVAAIFCLISYFIFSDHSIENASLVFAVIAIFFIMAFFITIIHVWIRWVLLAVTLVIIPIAIVMVTPLFTTNITIGVLSLISGILLLVATAILFIPYHVPEEEREEREYTGR